MNLVFHETEANVFVFINNYLSVKNNEYSYYYWSVLNNYRIVLLSFTLQSQEYKLQCQTDS